MMKTAEPVLSVLKTMKLLETLSAQEEVGVTELAAAVDGNKSTVYRFLNTLSGLGYVSQNRNNEKYSLTLKLFQVGVQALNRLDIHKASLPVMEELAEYSKETIHLASMENHQVFYLDKIESPLALRVAMGSAQGRFAPVVCTGVGKVILANMGHDEKERMLEHADWTARTEYSVTTPEELEVRLIEIRKNGWAFDLEENEPGVRCVAAPIFDNKGVICGALSISGPSLRMTKEKMKKLALKVKEGAGKISDNLGYLKS
ncbi:IclR family transcriptional regulator [Oceanispirochaeta sp.]|jgi:IclR family KDG regulon transcriptional repressor|uniref:IclR family transcriptional regulator n=1 Tax=Oceanispirochaeta sp. TaxID=2035350 RepID=UPI0026359954|nr:IclR family transcriptional regulator [Oceanispirochaeta sp.]MDA3956038.1 IclR family transcriptional regulator [Oceanispirochaeta sp.]